MKYVVTLNGKNYEVEEMCIRDSFYSDIDDNALVAVIDRVEYECSERRVVIRYGRGNIENDAFEHLFDILARLCRDARSVRAIEAYDLLDLGSNSVGVSGGQVYFIDNGDYLCLLYTSRCV